MTLYEILKTISYLKYDAKHSSDPVILSYYSMVSVVEGHRQAQVSIMKGWKK